MGEALGALTIVQARLLAAMKFPDDGCYVWLADFFREALLWEIARARPTPDCDDQAGFHVH